jgi:two-component system sensor kinase FixL
LGAMTDISEQRKLERQLLRVAEEEQRRIGQDLHDGTGQELTGLAYLAHTLLDALRRQSSPEVELAEKIVKGIKRTQNQLRGFAKGLLPVDLDAHGLMVALKELVARTDDTLDIACRFQCDSPVHLSDNQTANHLYYIALEAITNAARHAGADRIVVVLHADGGLITLRITDNGRGMDEGARQSGGSGLSIMESRARLIGAQLDVQTAKQDGTQVSCTLSEDASRDPSW